MTERPILFSAPMIRAILAGTKSQTRRIVTPQPPRVEDVRARTGDAFSLFTDHHQPEGFRVAGGVSVVRDLMGHAYPKRALWICPYGVPGDRLWVRETHAFGPIVDDPDDWHDNPDDWATFYRADGDGRPWKTSHDEDAEEIKPPWRPSIFMPRWASRITLEVTSVRVERLHEITEEDAREEGVSPPYTDWTHRDAFAQLWRDINGSVSWDANPWVWVVGFKRLASKGES